LLNLAWKRTFTNSLLITLMFSQASGERIILGQRMALILLGNGTASASSRAMMGHHLPTALTRSGNGSMVLPTVKYIIAESQILERKRWMKRFMALPVTTSTFCHP